MANPRDLTAGVAVSIVVPVFNARPFLERCIDSILGQTYSNIEVILVDDGSTDGSGAICDRYSVADGRVTALHQPNAGAGAARNAGMRASSGEFVVFVDSDDFIDREMIGELVHESTANNAFAVCGVDEFVGGARSFRRLANLGDRGVLPIGQFLSRYVAPLGVNVFVGSPCNKLYSSALLKNHQLRFEEGRSFAEDYLFNLEYYRHIETVVVIDRDLYHYRRDTPGSLVKSSFVSMERRWDDYRRLFYTLTQLLDTHSLLSSCSGELNGFVEFGLRDSVRRAFRNQPGLRVREPARKLEVLWFEGLALSPDGSFECRDSYMKTICYFCTRGWYPQLAVALKLHAYLLTVGKWAFDRLTWLKGKTCFWPAQATKR